MAGVVLKGGKFSPRIIKDLRYYNPMLLQPGDDNILTQLPPPFDEDRHVQRVSDEACQHDWTIKEKQCILAEGGSNFQDEHKVAACCARCRTHVDLHLANGFEGQHGWMCSDFHHFFHEPSQSQGLILEDSYDEGNWRDLQHFRCREMACQAILTVRMSGPRLAEDHVDLLTDRARIEGRARENIAADPERLEGFSAAAPVVVLSNIRTYIGDSLKGTSRPIADNNKRWQVSLGDQCQELLEYLGFEREPHRWVPPKPDGNAPAPYANRLNIKLDDVLTELNILIAKQPEQERQQAQVTASLGPAQGVMADLLNCQEYKKSPAVRRQTETSYDEEHPWYACLGSVMDEHDDLLKYAYNRQVQSDEHNTPFYFDCLRGIAEGRRSEELQTEAALAESNGIVGSAAIEKAYKSFGFDMNSWQLSDEMIIGNYEARTTDSSKEHHHALQQDLTIIGKHRNSKKILDFIAESLSTYEDALAFLGASDDMTPEFIVAMAGVKINDNPANEDKVRQAVELIAEHKNDNTLRDWVKTGELIEKEYTPEQAYARLGIAADCDEQTVLVGYKEAVKTQVSQREDLQRALRVIAKHKDSHLLLNHCEGDSPNFEDPAGWPVGLENTSNACHFNSTLQMLFSIKPFRELIINADTHKKSLERDEIKQYTVGNRKISRAEVKHGQDFLDDMRATFESMIKSPFGAVTPTEAMVENAFGTVLASPGLTTPNVLTTMDSLDGIDATLAAADDDNMVEGDDEKRKDQTSPGQEREVVDEDAAMSDDSLTTQTETGDAEEGTKKEAIRVEPKAAPPPAVTVDTSYRQQQDVTETAANTFFRLSCALAATNTSDPTGSEQVDPVISMLYGRSKDLNADTGEKTSDQDPKMFNIVSVNVRDTLEEALELGWCYAPEGSKIYRYTSISKLPPVFQIQINRRQYSRDRGAWKDDGDVKIPETLHLGHFLDDAEARVKEQWKDIARTILALDKDLGEKKDLLTKVPHDSKTGLAPLQAMSAAAQGLRQAAKVLAEDDPDREAFPKAADVMDAQVAKDKEELEAIDQTISDLTEKLRQMRADLPKKVPYRLHSVFVHRGTATSGHYFVFIYDFKAKIWRKYNDKSVKKAEPDAEAIFHNFKQPEHSSTDTPFFLTYVAADKVEELVDPLCRHIVEPPVRIEIHEPTSELVEGTEPMSKAEAEGAEENSADTTSRDSNMHVNGESLI